MDTARLPLVDIGPLLDGSAPESVGAALDAACREWGFFYLIGHGVDLALQRRLESRSQEFFALPLAEKMEIEMARGGRAWRGYFPVGGELTSGRPDRKEGLYFGAELDHSDARVRAGVALFGPNLFPSRPAGLRGAVLEYVRALTALGQTVMQGIAYGLGLAPDYFARAEMRDPLVLFRIFNYSAQTQADDWGVGEHTDYGVLTILRQDSAGGLAVRSPRGWVEAPPVDNAFVCNIGDMLERMTGGLYRSTPHRVRNASGRARLSFPFFFDPGFDAEVRSVRPRAAGDDAAERWDGASVHAFAGTYGDYLLTKVTRVFPLLGERVDVRAVAPPAGAALQQREGAASQTTTPQPE